MLASILVLASSNAAESIDALMTQDTAKEVKNPILPTLNEMFWAAVFFLVLWALMKYVLLPRIVKVMDGRAERVRSDHAAAEAAEDDRIVKLEQYEAGLAGARAEAVAIIEAARSEADAQRRTEIAAAEADVAAIKADAAADVADAKARARAELTGSITDLAVDAASAVVGRPVDRSAQASVVEDYVNSAGRN